MNTALNLAINTFSGFSACMAGNIVHYFSMKTIAEKRKTAGKSFSIFDEIIATSAGVTASMLTGMGIQSLALSTIGIPIHEFDEDTLDYDDDPDSGPDFRYDRYWVFSKSGETVYGVDDPNSGLTSWYTEDGELIGATPIPTCEEQNEMECGGDIDYPNGYRDDVN